MGFEREREREREEREIIGPELEARTGRGRAIDEKRRMPARYTEVQQEEERFLLRATATRRAASYDKEKEKGGRSQRGDPGGGGGLPPSSSHCGGNIFEKASMQFALPSGDEGVPIKECGGANCGRCLPSSSNAAFDQGWRFVIGSSTTSICFVRARSCSLGQEQQETGVNRGNEKIMRSGQTSSELHRFNDSISWSSACRTRSMSAFI